MSRSDDIGLRGIIFDLDGTLGNTLPVCFAAFRRIFERHMGHSFSDEEISEMFGPNEEGIIRRRLPEKYPQAIEEFMLEYDRAHDLCTAPFPGIEEALAMLRERGVKLGLVTGKGPRSAEISLRYLGIAHYFDSVTAGSPEGDRKPAAIRDLLAQWRLAPDVVAYVGDSPLDMESAHETGILAVAAAWAETADVVRLIASDPDVMFTSVGDFAEWAEERC